MCDADVMKMYMCERMMWCDVINMCEADVMIMCDDEHV